MVPVSHPADDFAYALAARTADIHAAGNQRIDAIRVASKAICRHDHAGRCPCIDVGNENLCTALVTYGMRQAVAIRALEMVGYSLPRPKEPEYQLISYGGGGGGAPTPPPIDDLPRYQSTALEPDLADILGAPIISIRLGTASALATVRRRASAMLNRWRGL